MNDEQQTRSAHADPSDDKGKAWRINDESDDDASDDEDSEDRSGNPNEALRINDNTAGDDG